MVRYFVSSCHRATFEITVGEISLQCGCVPLDFIFWGCLPLCIAKDLGLEFACRFIILRNDMDCPSYCFKQCSSISICLSSGSSFPVWMSLVFQNQAHKFSGSLGGRFFCPLHLIGLDLLVHHRVFSLPSILKTFCCWCTHVFLMHRLLFVVQTGANIQLA